MESLFPSLPRPPVYFNTRGPRRGDVSQVVCHGCSFGWDFNGTLEEAEAFLRKHAAQNCMGGEWVWTVQP